MWNDKCGLPDGSNSISNIQDYFECIIKKHETLTDNSPIRIYVNKNENRTIFKIKTRYYLELLTRKTKLLENTKNKMPEDENGENALS